MATTLPPLQKAELPNGETLAYREFNKERANSATSPLVLIHGNQCDHLIWRPLIEHPSLKDTHMIALDLRGFGESSYKNQPIDNHKMHAADVVQFMEKLSLKKPRISGYSTGGAIAMQIAADYPDVPHSIYVHSGVPFNGIKVPKRDADGKAIDRANVFCETKADLDAGMDAILKEISTLQQGSLQEGHQVLNFIVLNNVPAIDDPLYTEWRDGARRQKANAETMVANAMWNVTPDTAAMGEPTNDIAKIKCPIIAIHGEKDFVCAYPQFKEQMEKYGPGHSKMYTHPYGHFGMIECLDVVAEHYINGFAEADRMLSQ
eukprot:GFYU01003693.1.p1 GENE.GFYU01003693.1~~GFYU01003693.1.p1  ORF type:complete len:342 (+),score=78.85 GFYU01003693.1:75-1028(+)